MSGLPYYKRFPVEVLDTTIGLSLETKGAYAVALDLIALHAGLLPDDARYISCQLGCSVRKWNVIRADLIAMGYLCVAGGGLSAPILTAWSRRQRPPLPAALRAFVFERDGYRCTYCGDDEGPFEPDHVLAVARGGGDEPENLTCACMPCNRSKGAKLLIVWLASR